MVFSRERKIVLLYMISKVPVTWEIKCKIQYWCTADSFKLEVGPSAREESASRALICTAESGIMNLTWL